MDIVQADAAERKLPPQANDTLEFSLKPVPAAWGQVIPGDEQTSREHVFEASKRLVEAGLSVIPIDAYEGTKGPDSLRLPHPHDPVNGKPKHSWSVYKIRRPNMEELERWHSLEGDYGLAVLGGAVSGGQYGHGLEVIDIDTADLAKPWTDAVERAAPGLVDRLVRVRTPRPGLHVYYRCSRFGLSQKLALGIAKDDLGQPSLDLQGNPVRKTLIEVKAEGGYCLIAPSPARCHPSGRLYRYVEGSPELTAVPTITPDERTILLEAARSLNQWQEKLPACPRKALTKSATLSLPGHDFDARANWVDILTPHGWMEAGPYGDETRWTRPGKDHGVSAVTNHNGNNILHVFTSSASPLEAEVNYGKFHAYTVLNHGGDFKAAAADLREQGYGSRGLKAGKR